MYKTDIEFRFDCHQRSFPRNVLLMNSQKHVSSLSALQLLLMSDLVILEVLHDSQHIRNMWLAPLRKSSDNSRRCLSVNCITLIFAIAICVFMYSHKDSQKNNIN